MTSADYQVEHIRPEGLISGVERRVIDQHKHQNNDTCLDHFQYKPLDRSRGAVRLIKVYPLQDNGRIHCRIERHHISSTAYVALSYVWGHDSVRCTILLNGQTFQVRPNLFAFLRHAAKNKHFLNTLFWIDAISINQADVNEKNGHVRHMGAIYGSASKVIAWLGNSSGPLVMRTRPPNRWICCDQLTRDEVVSQRHSCHWRVPVSSSWDMVMHPYWSRLWIAQELGLASRVDVLWRGRFYNWFRLRKHLASNVAQQRKQGVDPSKTPFVVNLEFINNLPIARYFRRAETEPLGNLVPRFALHDCQVGHDHAYALLSLASDGSRFEPDYTESCISLLLRLMTFCYAHPTATFTSKIGSALRLDPTGKGIAVDVVGHCQAVVHPVNGSGIYYRIADHYAEIAMERDTNVVVRLLDTNLHFLFQNLHMEQASSGTTYRFLSRVDAISGRVEQAKHKFGRRSRKDRDSTSAQSQGLQHLQQMTLVGDETDRLRLHTSLQAVLAIFELSMTEATRGRLESRIRNWDTYADSIDEQQQVFTIRI